MRKQLSWGLIAVILAGCASSVEQNATRFLEGKCDDILLWSEAPLPNKENRRTVFFEWVDCADCITMYASMSADHELDAADERLYGSVAGATHYYTLDVFAYGIAYCFTNKIKTAKNADGEYELVSAERKIGKRLLSVEYSKKICRVERYNFDGCTKLSVSEAAD